MEARPRAKAVACVKDELEVLSLEGRDEEEEEEEKPPMYPSVSGRTERVHGERLVTRPAARTMR